MTKLEVIQKIVDSNILPDWGKVNMVRNVLKATNENEVEDIAKVVPK